MKNLSHLITYWFLRLVCFVFQLLPIRLAYLLAKGTGYLGFHLLRFRRRVVMDNLEIAFGRELDKEQLISLGVESYKQIAMTFLELIISPKLMKKHIGQMLQPEHVKLIQELLQQGRGLIIVSGHLGSWELQGAAAATALTGPLTVAAAQQSNPYIDRFITERRTAMGMQVAGTKEAMRLLLKALRNGEAVGLAADQNAGLTAVFIDFFGKTAATMPGPAQLALKFNAPMLVGAVIRTGPAQFRILLQQVEIKEDDTIKTLTRRHVQILESFIRQYPEQYFWMHRRWKTRPADE